jgi:hypothetical protein
VRIQSGEDSYPRLLGVLLLCIAMAAPFAAAAAPASLVIVATMHGLHKGHPTYDYEHLYALVRDLHPDFVGVEIRPEDMGRDSAYLKANYPTEMIALAQQYGSKAFGFDWLGDDVAGRPIPADWWRAHSPIKKLERERMNDAKYQDTPALKSLESEEHDILAHATGKTLNDGRYDRLSQKYYALLEQQFANSPYAALSRFYSERDQHLCLNIVKMIRANPGKRIVVATGADHRFALVMCVPKALSRSVRLIGIDAGLSAN